MTNITLFDLLVLLTLVPSETSILSQYNIFILFIIHIGVHIRKLKDNICYFHEKAALTTIFMLEIEFLFRGN